MTTPVSLRTLDEGHRAQQAANAAAVQKLVMRLFVKMVDPVNISAPSTTAWLRQAILEILKGRQTAITLATAYATAVRRVQVPGAPAFTIPKVEDVPIEKLVRSLTYTGPGKLAVDIAKTPKPIEPSPSAPHFEWVQFDHDLADWEKQLKELPVKAAVASSAAAARHVADGGRDLIDAVVQNDELAVGYIRITKATPCAFCLMLASRGPVYKKDSFKASDARFTGPGNHKCHDGCMCTLRPIFGSKSTKNWTDQARQAEDLWINAQDEHGRTPSSYSGKDAINAFARIARARGLADLNRW